MTRKATATAEREPWSVVSTLVRAGREFAAVPVAVIAAFLVLAVLAVMGDQGDLPGSVPMRRALGHVIGKDASAATLQAVATGLVTVTSITFSVLLLAVQQTASNLSPVVFDQFVRRRSNQAFLGFFVGLALFAYLVMAAVQDGMPPIIGAALATLLTIGAMAILLALVYSTIDQMRPANVMRQIHDRALRAREREGALIQRTMRDITSTDPVRATYSSLTTGYVTGVDLPLLEAALREVPNAQIELHVALGDSVTYGRIVASVYDEDERDAQAIADQVRGALTISPQRDLDHDATTGIDELANIAWTAGSTAKQSPEVSRQALHSLTDIAARWLSEDPAAGGSPDGLLPIAYPDPALDRLFEVLYSLVVAAVESRQHMQAARVLQSYRQLLEEAPPPVHQRIAEDLEWLEPLLDDVPHSPMLSTARQKLRSKTVPVRERLEQ